MNATTSLRRWLWKRVRRYRYEICHACGRPVGHHHRFGNEPLTWWRAPDDLWNAIEGGAGGLRCPQCFTRDCERLGVPIHWVAVPEAKGEALGVAEMARILSPPPPVTDDRGRAA